MAYINVDEVYILDNTGLQVDMTTDLPFKDAGLTESQQAQARANIAAGGSNRNLLDNPWFTVDQTSVTTGSNPAATAVDVRDRWRVAYCTSYTFNNDGTITTVWNGSGAGAYLIQYALLDEAALWTGKEVTFSGYVDGVLVSKTFTLPTSGGVLYTLTDGVYLRCNNVTANNRGFEFQVYHTNTSGKTLGPFKLEKGSVSTLPNDGPPDYEEELRKCQYVFRRFTVGTGGAVFLGWAYANTGANFPNIIGGSNMRAKPTATFSGSIAVRDASGTDHAVTSLGTDYDPPCVALSAVTTGLTANTVVRLRILSSAYIDLSCRPS